MKGSIAAGLCVSLALVLGCGNKAPKQQSPADKDGALRAQLVGLWERPWDFGPVGYIRELKADGSLVMHELRDPNSAAGAAASAPVESPLTMDHPLYKVKLRTIRRETGSWAVENGNLVCSLRLANGDPMRIIEKIERVSSTELVLSRTGVEGKTETRFQRGK